jgi:hypothetical protein
VTSRTIILDTNLLLLLMVGATRRGFIQDHKRLSNYLPEDYDRLVDLIGDEPLVVTPHILTETSNLLPNGVHEPLRPQLRLTLKRFVTTNQETHIPARIVIERGEFTKLGLTDCAVLEYPDREAVLLTDDLELHERALATGRKSINFNHVREEYL